MPERAASREKAAAPKSVGLGRRRVPHYRQTTDFTCGPSACLMAMSVLEPGRRRSRTEHGDGKQQQDDVGAVRQAERHLVTTPDPNPLQGKTSRHQTC